MLKQRLKHNQTLKEFEAALIQIILLLLKKTNFLKRRFFGIHDYSTSKIT